MYILIFSVLIFNTVNIDRYTPKQTQVLELLRICKRVVTSKLLQVVGLD